MDGIGASAFWSFLIGTVVFGLEFLVVAIFFNSSPESVVAGAILCLSVVLIVCTGVVVGKINDLIYTIKEQNKSA